LGKEGQFLVPSISSRQEGWWLERPILPAVPAFGYQLAAVTLMSQNYRLYYSSKSIVIDLV
jgi:hypothetical protein